jgi:predicted Zn-dependent protease
VTRATEVAPLDPWNHDLQATIDLARGYQSAAEGALTRAAQLSATNPVFHRRLSDVLMRRGNAEGAFWWANRTVADFPGDPAGQIQLGNLHLAGGRLDDAEAAFKQALDMPKTSPAQVAALTQRLGEIAKKRPRAGVEA